MRGWVRLRKNGKRNGTPTPAAEIFIRSSLRFVKNLLKNTKSCQERMRQSSSSYEVEKSVSTTFSTPLIKSTPPVAHVEPPDKPPYPYHILLECPTWTDLRHETLWQGGREPRDILELLSDPTLAKRAANFVDRTGVLGAGVTTPLNNMFRGSQDFES